MSSEHNNFFYNKEYLESIYNMLKGEDKELKKKKIMNYIQSIEGITYKGKHYFIV